MSQEIQQRLRERISKLLAAARAPAPVPIGAGEGRSLDAIVAFDELNDAHGTGLLVQTVFADGPPVLSIRSVSLSGGRQSFGFRQLCLEHGPAERPAVYERLLTATGTTLVHRILTVPYGTDDVRTAIALHDLHGAPMCTWVMDGQNVAESHVPDSLMSELLRKSRLRLAISPEIRDAYEAKYGVPFGVVPPLVPPHRIHPIPRVPSAEQLRPDRGAVAGHVWSGAWLDLLRSCVRRSGLRVDWFCPGGTRFMNATPAEVAADGIRFHGAVPEDELVRDLRERPFVVVPSGTLDERDDRPAISRMSLPSRITFVLAATNTPMLVLGHPDTAAARFVVNRGVGLCAPYDPDAIAAAVDRLLDPGEQRRMRERAAAMAPSFSTTGVREWLWRSLTLGEPADHRFEALFPREARSGLPGRSARPVAGVDGPVARPTSSGATGERFDAVVAHVEVTDHHGVGVLLQRVFGTAPRILSIRSQDQFGGEQRFGDRNLRLSHGAATRSVVYERVLSALEGTKVDRILACPYFADDAKTAVVLSDLHGAPICTWLMDDQNVVEQGIPDPVMAELLERSRVRFAISGEMRDAYEAKYGLRFGVVPPTVSPDLVQDRPLDPPRTLGAERGAIVGNVWGRHWLDLLRRALRGSGLRLDWFCNSGARWFTDSESELEADGLFPCGRLPTEEQLKRELQCRPFAVVPSGTLDDQDDRRAIATLSLPSRVVFIFAATNTPVLVLGSRETAAARFVTEHGIGVAAGYEPSEISSAVAHLLDPGAQREMRRRAATLAPSFSSDGLREWIWRSMETGKPADRRFEDLFPRSRPGRSQVRRSRSTVEAAC